MNKARNTNKSFYKTTTGYANDIRKSWMFKGTGQNKHKGESIRNSNIILVKTVGNRWHKCARQCINKENWQKTGEAGTFQTE
jgi:hypothetical protein